MTTVVGMVNEPNRQARDVYLDEWTVPPNPERSVYHDSSSRKTRLYESTWLEQVGEPFEADAGKESFEIRCERYGNWKRRDRPGNTSGPSEFPVYLASSSMFFDHRMRRFKLHRSVTRPADQPKTLKGSVHIHTRVTRSFYISHVNYIVIFLPLKSLLPRQLHQKDLEGNCSTLTPRVTQTSDLLRLSYGKQWCWPSWMQMREF